VQLATLLHAPTLTIGHLNDLGGPVQVGVETAIYSNLAVPKAEFVAKDATLGQFKLTPEIIDKISGDEALAATDEQLSNVSSKLKSKLKVESDQFYLGDDPANPEIGDEKISFTVLRPGTISIVAAQAQKSFAPYTTQNEREIELVESGNVPAAQMFAHALSANRTLTWILRAVGFGAMFFGGLLLLGPIIVNILAFHIFITAGQGLLDPMLDVIIVLALYLLWAGRKAFAGLLI
jgi:hypothetical protein